MSDIDAYIARFKPELQQRLQYIRRTALDVFTGAGEKLYYGYPALCLHGKVLLFYGAYKAHVSICVGEDWIDFLKGQFPQYSYTQATIKFPHKEPLPEDVVRVICELLRQGMGGNGH